MTYEQFVAKMQEHEGRIGLDPNDEMKEVFRWATQNHFDHFWRYTTEPKNPAECLSEMCLSEPEPKPRPVPNCPLEEMLRLEHGLILRGATLYGDPNPAPGYAAVYCWENEEGGIVAALVVTPFMYGDGHTIELVVADHIYTRHPRSENEMGQTINYFVNNARARYGGSKSLGEFPLHVRFA
ncbi:MAG: hypothetical protein EB075_07490 [Bacteroidetes bacterium]|nr:hypothetical protein [Bacteroidota bacterium]